MKAVLFVLFCMTAAVLSVNLTESQTQYLFSSFVNTYNKKYETKNVFARYATFKENLSSIMMHNLDASNTYTLAVNAYADMTKEEWLAFIGPSIKIDNVTTADHYTAEPHITAESYIDWNVKGKVPKVMDVGSCAGTWATTPVMGASASYAVTYGATLSLSAQHILDCTIENARFGCSGGSLWQGYSTLQYAGAYSTAAYPWVGRDGLKCATEGKRPSIYGYQFENLKQVSTGQATFVSALNLKPVMASLNAADDAFRFYKSGVINKNCSGGQTNLNILAYGYVLYNRVPSYVYRNAWGTAWGQSGDVYIQAGSNVCAAENASKNFINIGKA